MRTFSIFVSALAFANLAQASPLVTDGSDLSQLDADLEAELEAELPLRKDTANELLAYLSSDSSVLNYAKNGAPVTHSDEHYTTWKRVSSDSFEEKPTDHTRDKVTSSLNEADLQNWAKTWSKKTQIYQTQNAHPRDFRDFSAWAAKMDKLIPKFTAEVNKPSINNSSTPVSDMKHAMSQMIDCLKNKDCRTRFIAHTVEVAEAQ